MTTPKIPLAVVGCGAVAASHYLPCLAAASGLQTALLVDRDLGRAGRLAARWGVPAVSAEVSDVARHARAAVVALPNHLHAPVSIELLRQGVDVLVEKPMATSAAECDAMTAAAREGGALLDVGLQFRFFDSTRWVSEILESGVLGDLRAFEMRLGVVSRWPFASDYFLRRATAGGGVLTDYGAHVLDLLLFWLGEFRPPRYRDDAMGGVESDCELELETIGGIAGRVEISRTRNLPNTCVFEGSRARLEVGIWDPDPPIALRRAPNTAGGTAPNTAGGTVGGAVELLGRARGPEARGLDFNGAFLRSLDDFAAAIRERRQPAVPAAEGRRAVELIEACYRVRQPLDLPWMRPPGSAEELA